MLAVILLAVLPLAVSWLWLKRKVNIDARYFLAALAAGVLSLALAAVVQILLPALQFSATGGMRLVFLVRAALIEEGSRLVMLMPLLAVTRLFDKAKLKAAGMMTAAVGMVAGLAFSAVETAVFALASPTTGPARLLRLSAVLLHAACGIRCALASGALLSKNISFLPNFARAVALHTVYNFIVLHTGARYYILGLLLTLISFISAARQPADLTQCVQSDRGA
jgi:hypothetical protein